MAQYDEPGPQEKEEEKEGVAAGVGTGLGCLGIGLLPWTFILLVVLFLALLALFSARGCA